MPVVWLGLSKNDVGLPLNHFFVHDLTEENDVKALIGDVARVCRIQHNETPIPGFLKSIMDIAPVTPIIGLEATPFRSLGRAAEYKCQSEIPALAPSTFLRLIFF